VREAVGVAAYLADDFAEAARELRAYRRMSGDEGYRAVLADCERALGRPDNALRLVTEALAQRPDPEEVVELRLVEAGARHDLGELPAALLVLETALGGRPTPGSLAGADLGRLRLATAYADLLEERGDGERAAEWYSAIAAADPDDLTGVSSRFGEDEDGTTQDDAGLDEGVADDAPATRADLGIPEAGPGAEDEDPDAVPGDEVPLDDIEAEVAELLGEAPTSRGAPEFDHSRLFQEAPRQPDPDQDAVGTQPDVEDQHPPTD
jgi:tetratricopeptide (TPR) repeat protein